MPAPPTAPARVREFGRTLAILAAVAVVGFAYAWGHLSWYRDTPLGQVPVLDEYENLVLGEAIVRGELPPEPFYRAMGYPLLLAALRGVGVETTGLFAAALAAGALLHALNAALVAGIARAWFGGAAAAAAGLLVALNPVLVHYATQALDATSALTLFLAGLCCIAPALTPSRDSPGATWRWAAVSLAWAAATATRPNYLLAWCALPALAAWIRRGDRRLRTLAAALSGAIVFAAVAGWQWRVSGVAGFLPWQGTYNLWAANQPGTHGRYFAQRVSIPSSVATLNTTRAESIRLFHQETGAAPADIGALNAHWRRRFVDHITAHPFTWLGLLARKSYALLNNWEQYNNKTFAFHQARSPWLRWNPLGWGVIFIVAVAGGARLWREQPRAARFATVIALATAAAVLLFFVSARFRLPLAALAAVLAGGALAAPGFWRPWPRRTQILLGAAVLLAGGLTFSRFDGVRGQVTFVEDHLLIAHAADRVGDYTLAWTEATAALERIPQHRNAQRVAVAAYFNQLVSVGAGPGPESQWLEISRRYLARDENDERDLQAVAVVAIWRANQRAAAVAEWRRLGRTPSALAARLLVNDRTVSPAELGAVPPPAWSQPLVRLAAAHLGLVPPPGVKPGDPDRAAAVLRRIFAPSAMTPPR